MIAASSRSSLPADGRGLDAADLLVARGRRPRRRARDRFVAQATARTLPADFIIRDNRVPQQVTSSVSAESSLNVGLAFDLSDSVAGTRLEQLRAASKALTSELEPADQSGLVTFDETVSLRCPLSLDRSCVDRSLAAAEPTSNTALVDGILSAMITGAVRSRPRAADGIQRRLDTSSFLTTDRVLDMGPPLRFVVYSIASKGARPISWRSCRS